MKRVPRFAVLDANVLYSAAMRDFFMRLAALERTRDLMNQYGNDWRVPAYGHLLPTLTLPDPEDRHVLAAAIAVGAPVIVTSNIGDFPPAILAGHGIRAVRPDAFACELRQAEPARFLRAVRDHRTSLRHPPKTVREYLSSLAACGLPKLAEILEIDDEL